MKKLKYVFSFILLFFISILSVDAASFKISTNKSTVVVGNTIDLTVRASDITGFSGGLATVQGDISFDDNFLTYVKYQNASSSLSSSYGTTTKRFVSLGMGGEYISSSDNIKCLLLRTYYTSAVDIFLRSFS